MRTIRWGAVVATAAALVVAPTVTPVWAAPHPVTPSVHRTPIGGVDAAALSSAPAARDPAAVASAPNGSVDPARRAAPSTKPAVFTAPLTPGRFTAAGVSWRPTADGPAVSSVTVQVRVRERGAWTDWLVLGVEGGPDEGTTEAGQQHPMLATQPYSTADADAIQVRVDAPRSAAPSELTLVTVDPGTSSADAALQPAPGATAHSAAAQPTIVSRAGWGADESIRTCTPDVSPTIKVGFVHHTDGSNSYAAADSASIVRGIYAYHVQGNGWCDVGYNFLVDRFGTRFEGRYGSLTQPVIGAHTLAFNYNSFSVAAMGSFMTASPPAAMTASITQVLGWKLSLYGRDPRGTDTLTSAGGSGARWPAGTAIRFNVVSGHRDAYATDCPGDTVYAQLPAMREAAAQNAGGSPAPVSAIDRHNETLGGRLGAATGPEVGVAGGAMRPYERGVIYWSAATGALVVWGALLVKYLALGGPRGFGLRKTDEVGVAGGARSSFTRGSLFWSSATGAHLVWGANLVRYDALGGPTALGFPTTDEVGVAGGSRNTFTRGSLFWAETTGTHLVWGANLVKYDALGGPAFLGFPTTDEVGVAGGARSTFTRGSLFWAERTAAHFVWGDILVAYDRTGGPAGELGFATTDEVAVPGGARSTFENGRYIDWSAGAGAVVH